MGLPLFLFSAAVWIVWVTCTLPGEIGLDDLCDKTVLKILYLSLPVLCFFVLRKASTLADRVVRANGQICPNCAYDLRGLASAVCPECGARFTPRERMVIWAFSPSVTRKLDKQWRQGKLGPWLALRVRAGGLLRVFPFRVRRRRLLRRGRAARIVLAVALAGVVLAAPRLAGAIARADAGDRMMGLAVAAFLGVVVAGYLGVFVYRARRLDAAGRRYSADRPLRCGRPKS